MLNYNYGKGRNTNGTRTRLSSFLNSAVASTGAIFGLVALFAFTAKEGVRKEEGRVTPVIFAPI